MRLAVAPGSDGYYRVDIDGRVYTARYHMPGRPGQPAPGVRPLRGTPQVAGGHGCVYWLPIGQHETLTPEFVALHWPDVVVAHMMREQAGRVGGNGAGN